MQRKCAYSNQDHGYPYPLLRRFVNVVLIIVTPRMISFKISIMQISFRS